MKNATMIVATLLALALGAQGQTSVSAVEEVAKAWVATNTVETVMPDGGKGRKASKAVAAGDVAQIIAAPNADIGPSGVWMLAQAVKADVAGTEAKLEAIEGDNKLDAAIRENAARSLMASVKNSAKAKGKLAKLPVTDATARALTTYAGNHGDKKTLEDWFATAKGKGLSIGRYRQWYLSQLKEKPANEQLFDIQQEIAGLMRSATSLDTAKPWVEELRYRLYVAKEASGQ